MAFTSPANKGGLADALFGGWEISLIFRYQSGTPIAIYSNNSYAGWNGAGYPIYVNRNAGVSLSNQFDPSQFDQSNQNSPNNRYFDPKAFSNPAYGDFGEGPGRLRAAAPTGSLTGAPAKPPKMMQRLGLTPFRAIKYDPPGPTACGVTCARTSS